jgi:transposase
MKSVIRFVGLDVHAETIAVAVAETGGESRSVGVIPNSADAVRKLVGKLGPAKNLRACYEAGPCGYTLYWQLVELGVQCDVVAPTLVPVKAGDRVKTDRRDAEKLAKCHRAGDLTPVWVPDAAHEALRDLVRARLAAKQDQQRARVRLKLFLLRHGLRAPDGMKAWKGRYRAWLNTLKFEHRALEVTFLEYVAETDHSAARVARLERAIDEAIETAPERVRALVHALQTMRGVAKVCAATVVTELGDVARFESAPQLMSYVGLVPREHSSGGKTSRGTVTKTGNAHIRRVVVEAAWAYRHKPRVGTEIKARQRGESAAVVAIAWKAQHRLHTRYRSLLRTGKHKNKAMVALARELLGFMWGIGKLVQHETARKEAA